VIGQYLCNAVQGRAKKFFKKKLFFGTVEQNAQFNQPEAYHQVQSKTT
jgi:hypothetical protein